MKVWMLLLSLIVFKGCDEGPPAIYQSGKITDIRMTFESLPQKVESGNPLGGAIVGHMIAGKKGMIIGAIAASGDTITPAQGKLIACQFDVQLDSGEETVMTFVNVYSSNLPRCSLQREGDKVKLVKYPYQSHWEWVE